MRTLTAVAFLLAILLPAVAAADIIINMPGSPQNPDPNAPLEIQKQQTISPRVVVSNTAVPNQPYAQQQAQPQAQPQPYNAQRLPNNLPYPNAYQPAFPQPAFPQRAVPNQKMQPPVGGAGAGRNPGAVFPPTNVPSAAVPNAGGMGIQYPCTQMWCQEGLSITLPFVTTPGTYRFTVTADGQRFSCSGALPLKPCGMKSITCDKPGIRVMESGCALPAAQHAYTMIMLEKIPKVALIELSYPGRAPVRAGGPVRAQCSFPNGQRCDARPCCQAQINVGP